MPSHACAILQEVQLYTANTDNKSLTTGLRRSPFSAESSKDSCSPVQQGSKSCPASATPDTSSQKLEQDDNPQLPSQTHCSRSNLESQGGIPSNSSGSGSADKVAARLHEMMADSEETKDNSAMHDGQESPHSSSPRGTLFLAPGRLSSTLRQQHSADLQQHGSGGSNTSTDMPASTSTPPQWANAPANLPQQSMTATAQPGFQTPGLTAR